VLIDHQEEAVTRLDSVRQIKSQFLQMNLNADCGIHPLPYGDCVAILRIERPKREDILSES
jgi:hypothetical protein